MGSIDLHVARRLRGKRRALGLSEEAVARALGIDVARITAYEHGTEAVPPQHLNQLAEFLGVPASYFLPPTHCPDS